MEEMRSARMGGGVWSSMLPSDVTPPQHLAVFTNLEALGTPSFRGFYGGFATQAQWIKLLPIGD